VVVVVVGYWSCRDFCEKADLTLLWEYSGI